jgi:hypothetical protein
LEEAFGYSTIGRQEDSRLKILSLRKNKILQKDFEGESGSLVIPKSIQKLDLGDNDIRSKGVIHIFSLNQIISSRSLKELNITKNNLDSSVIELIAEYIKVNTTIEYLNLANNPSIFKLSNDNKPIEMLRDALAINTTLKTLVLDNTGLSLQALVLFSQAISEFGLFTLSIRDEWLSLQRKIVAFTKGDNDNLLRCFEEISKNIHKNTIIREFHIETFNESHYSENKNILNQSFEKVFDSKFRIKTLLKGIKDHCDKNKITSENQRKAKNKNKLVEGEVISEFITSFENDISLIKDLVNRFYSDANEYNVSGELMDQLYDNICDQKKILLARIHAVPNKDREMLNILLNKACDAIEDYENCKIVQKREQRRASSWKEPNVGNRLNYCDEAGLSNPTSPLNSSSKFLESSRHGLDEEQSFTKVELSGPISIPPFVPNSQKKN